TPDGSVYVSEMADGEVILAPALATEFSGTALPSGWSTTEWNAGSTVSVAGGRVAVDGAFVGLDNLLPPGQSLEFGATFSGDPFEHAGFALTLNDTLCAMFPSPADR